MKSALLFDFTVQSWIGLASVDNSRNPRPMMGAETLASRDQKMDFREGGSWHYVMVGPEGEKHWGKASYIAIKEEESFMAKDGFCDEMGTMNPTLRQNLNNTHGTFSNS